MDLNRIKKYLFKETIDRQIKKIAEEIHEFWWEIKNGNKDRIISEGLDVIQAIYNYLVKLGMTHEDFELHIEKLEMYKEKKYQLEEQNK